ncbi:MAG: DUF1501 domain-containing protein [Planctomycetia bacterium]|nr:DUF1501 domain-containing protein [Planctomycetia bacterium]
MLEFLGRKNRFCDAVDRRDFLQAGFLGLAGLSLGDLLRARAANPAPAATKKSTSVILVWLGGGPSHIDMWDMKPDAPLEVRGEYASIATSLPGVRICEHMPHSARVMDKCALIRSMTHGDADHASAAHYLLTGHEPSSISKSNEMPSYGSIASKECGARRAGVPAYVAIPEPPGSGYAGYLGQAYNPFIVGGDPSDPAYQVRDLMTAGNLGLDRIEDRIGLLNRLDGLRRTVDNSGVMEGLDAFHHKAFEMITSPAAQRAFDLNQESAQVRDRYGRTTFGQSMLLARRLVEAGVTFVTVKNNGWDTHQRNFTTLRNDKLPEIDRPWGTFIDDMYERGLMDDTLVVLMGEFGRSWFITPPTSGREHWPKCYSLVVAGGGMKMGQVIGASDSRGAFPFDRPVTPEDFLQTVYGFLGIDTQKAYVNDADRPFTILSGGRRIAELVG